MMDRIPVENNQIIIIRNVNSKFLLNYDLLRSGKGIDQPVILKIKNRLCRKGHEQSVPHLQNHEN